MTRYRSLPPVLQRLLPALPFLLLAAYIPSRLEPGLQFDAAIGIVFAFCILSLVVLTGYTGQISLCQATFMGVGAYSTGWLVNAMHVTFWLAVPLSMLIAFAVGVVVGIPALRLRGILLAIVTLGVALVFDKYFFLDRGFGWFTGGTGGWTLDSAPFFRWQLDGSDHLLQTYWVLLGLFVLVGLVVVNIHNSGSGRRFRAIRDSELAAATMGVDLTRYKLMAFGLSAAIAGLGGAFYPLVVGQVSPQPFSVFYSLQFAAFAVLMGIRFVPAAAIGGVFMAIVPDLLSRTPWHIRYDWFQVALGALLVAQMITLPDGVWGDLRKNAGKLAHRVSPMVSGETSPPVGKPEVAS